MTIYPAIDIKGGCAVRLRQGDFSQMTDYGDPVAAAQRWKDQGAEYIHVVDLDGALDGVGANLHTIEAMIQAVDLPFQLGGGIRSEEDIAIRLGETGVTRVILGTVATSNPELVQKVCRRWPSRIVLGLDLRNGAIMVRGWTAKSDISPEELLGRMADYGIDTVILTDISRDGLLAGPNVGLTRTIIEKTSMKVIASGGVSSLEDIRQLKDAGCDGVILGRALYDGNISLKDALKL